MSDEVGNKVNADVPTLEKKASAEALAVETSPEKIIDELTSIEREIASMHDAEEDEAVHIGELVSEDVLAVDEGGEKTAYVVPVDLVEDEDEDTQNSSTKQFERRNGASTVSELSDAPDSTGSPAQLKPNEAQLEHEDLLAVLKGTDDKDGGLVGVTIEGEGEFQIVDIIDNDVDGVETDPLAKDTPPKKEPLTKEEEHKLALEQYQSLQGPKYKNRRRKQDIKSITQPADLLTSLVSDWSDGDDANPDDQDGPPVAVPKKKLATTSAQAKAAVGAKPAESTPAVVKEKPAAAQPAKKTPAPAPTPATTQPKKLINAAQAQQEKKSPALPPPSPFKRTRIIKRKIIWDPDAPETQFSYAKLVKPSTPQPVKKEVKKDRATPTPKKKDEPVAVSTPTVNTATKRQIPAAVESTAAVNGSKKKKFSEVDRLLGDEGAVNMLNSLDGDRTKRTSESEPAARTPVNRKTVTAATPTAERAPTPQKKEPVQPKRRTPKPKASSSWDYVYKQQNDDSMIIRRRSNSSYSSSASINRLSVDGPVSAGKTPKGTPKSSPKTPQASPVAGSSPGKTPDSAKQFEFAKPENKNKGKKLKSPIILVNPLSADMKKAAAKRSTKSPVTAGNSSGESEPSDVTVTKIGTVRQVMFNTHRSKLGNTFTVQLMNELTHVLDRLRFDNECNVVVMLSDGPNFCQGIDFTDLALGTSEKRKNAAIQMAKAVKNLLLTLAKFQKPLIAGVSGVNSGLGVTMLPLFDVVIGSDKGSYETPYARIGQIPEGFYIFSETPKIRYTFKTKLLWLAEKLHSTESALSGLVNKLTTVTKVHEEALACGKRLAALSSESYAVMKQRSLDQSLPEIITSLDEEEKILIQQWCSAACVDNFKHFIHKGQW